VGLLEPYLSSDQRNALVDAAQEASVWESAAPALFAVTATPEQAAAQLPAYAAQAGVPVGTVPVAPVSFYALSLDEQGNPVPVMNSDGGFALLFGTPSADTLQRIVTDIVQPFPAGLITDAGKVFWLKVHEIPEASRAAKGKALVNLLALTGSEKVTATLAVKDYPEDRFVVMATKNGLIKKTELSAYSNPRQGGIIALGLEDGEGAAFPGKGRRDLRHGSGPHSERRFPGYDIESEELDADTLRNYIFGGHVSEYMETLADEDEERYKSQFAKYIEEEIDAGDLEELYQEAHKAIREDPFKKDEEEGEKKTKEEWKAESKKYKVAKLTHAERKARVQEKIRQLAA